MTKQICDNCKFYIKDEDSLTTGECRRYPPIILPYGREELPNGRILPMTASYHPAVDYDSWCGEFQDKHSVE